MTYISRPCERPIKELPLMVLDEPRRLEAKYNQMIVSKRLQTKETGVASRIHRTLQNMQISEGCRTKDVGYATRMPNEGRGVLRLIQNVVGGSLRASKTLGSAGIVRQPKEIGLQIRRPGRGVEREHS